MSRLPDYLPIALRAYTELPAPDQPAKGKPKRKRPSGRPSASYVLVLDPETSIDCSQHLTFGSGRFYRSTLTPSGLVKLSCLEEGVFYADELPKVDPDGYQVLCDYAPEHEPATDPAATDAAFGLRLYSRREFLRRFHLAAWKARATVVCFNFPFDISRLAFLWGTARVGRFAGGFSFALFDYNAAPGEPRENHFRPRVTIKSIDSKRALKGFAAPSEIDAVDRVPEGSTDGKPDADYVFRGHMLDLRTLAFSLTDSGHTLESACEAFDVPYTKRKHEHGLITPTYIDYNREDVEATARLYEALMSEFGRHPIPLQATKAYSPASMGKSNLKAMGIVPILKRQSDFPREILGKAMSAYFGGRTGCHIRRTPVPVLYCDFLSMYPTVNSLMGLWAHVITERIELVEDTEAVYALVEQLGPEDLLRPETWQKLAVLVEVEPDGEILPIRARYSDGRSWGIGVNQLHSSEPLWYALPDICAAKLLSGRAPKITRAIRLVPVGQQEGLKEVKLRGEVSIDPRTQDLFQAVIEERHRLPEEKERDAEQERLYGFLKVFANAASYGIYAEMNRQEQPEGHKVEVPVYGGGDEPFTARVSAPEHPGEFAFAPLAATITAGARLKLALLERLITDEGGTHTFDDTDAMAIVATEEGGPVACPGGSLRTPDGQEAVLALSYEQVDRIVGRFEALNPYDRDAVPGSILEIEKENFGPDSGERRQLYCYAISAKRYVLYNLDEDGEPILRKCSEHGLGHLLDPTVTDLDEPPARDSATKASKWIAQLWEHILREDGLGIPSTEPEWLDRPALSKTSISKPAILRRLDRFNRGKPAEGQVRPFNFALIAHVGPLGHPVGANPEKFALIAPYNRDHRQWRKLAWSDIYRNDGRRYTITTSGEPSERIARVLDYRGVLADYRSHPEPKSAGPDGAPCDRVTSGLLGRRAVHALPPTYIGKETNQLEEATAGLVHDLDEVVNEYPDPSRGAFSLVRQVLCECPVNEIVKGTGLSPSTMKRARAGRSFPHPANEAKLISYAATHARRKLREAGIRPPREDYAAIAAYLDIKPGIGARSCLSI